MLGPLISAGASIAGGLINRSSTQATNEMSIHQGNLNRAAQEEFAKKGIRWRVADARAAGIHPLYALGAQTTSFSPVSVGLSTDTSLGSGVASAGQDISRAINATRTGPERDAAFAKTIQDLQLTNMGLQNEQLAAQIAKLKASINPPMPTLETAATPAAPIGEEKKPEDRPQLMYRGRKILTDPGTSNVSSKTDRWGDEGVIPQIVQAAVAWEDAKQNMPNLQRTEDGLNRMTKLIERIVGPAYAAGIVRRWLLEGR